MEIDPEIINHTLPAPAQLRGTRPPDQLETILVEDAYIN
jgi:hypothetical protein